MSQSVETLKERFRFQSQALAADSFRVVRFSGREGLNKLYSFNITLVSQKPVDTEALLFSFARFEIDRTGGHTALFTGIPSMVTQGAQFNGWTFYTLSLQPSFQQLTRLVCNRIFLNKTVQQIVEDSLHDDAFLNLDFAFNLHGTYAPQDFTMQWNESIYDYVACKLERDGIYYYFDQQADHEKLIFTDSCHVHPRLPDTPPLYYSPDTGLEGLHYEEVITSFTLRRTPLPRHVIVRDYDWMHPNTPVEASAQVAENGAGNLYFYGDGFTTEAEGQRLATIRAQGLHCRGKQFFGESSVPSLRPGYLFRLDKHYDTAFNREYLITEITHEGSQEGFLSLVVGVTLEHPSDKLYYRNSFVCIPSDLQFRPERLTSRNRIGGVVNAFVDTSNTSGKPELDEHGRYKLVFPQDISGNSKGKASCWVRRAQPYVGPGYGSSFPLAPGVEVLVAFMDGDPDRPFITGAVGNAETRSVDNSSSGEFTGLYTAGGSGLVFNDKDKNQGVTLKAGRTGMFMASGSMDTTIQNSDYSLGIAGAVRSEFAGLTQKISSGFSAKLSSGLKSWTLAKRYPLILQLVRGISILGKACDPAANHGQGWNAAVEAAKALNLIENIVELAGEKEEDCSAYAASFSAESGKSALKMQSEISKAGLAEYVVWATLNFVASGAVTIATGVKKSAIEEQTQAKAIDAYKAAAVKNAKFSDAEQEKKHAGAIKKCLDDALIEKRRKAKVADSSLLPNELSLIELSKEEKNVALASLFNKDKLKADDRKDWDAFEKKTETRLKYAKGSAIASATFSSVSALVGETLALALIIKKSKFAYHAGIKKFGGLAISAPKSNVLITGAEGVCVGSNAGVVLQALPDIHEKLTKKEPATLWGEKRTPSKHTLTTEAVATVMHTAGDAEAVAGKHKIVAVSELTLTNKISEAGDAYGKLLDSLTPPSAVTSPVVTSPAVTPPAVDPHLQAASAAYAAKNPKGAPQAAPAEIPFSTISMKDDTLELLNVGNVLNISQTSPDSNNAMKLNITQSCDDKTQSSDDKKISSALSFTKDMAELVHKNEGKVRLLTLLTLKPSSASLSASKDSAVAKLDLTDKSATLQTKDTQFVMLDEKKLALQRSDSLNIVLTDAGNALDMKAAKCTLEADSVTIGKGGSKFELTSASITISNNIIKIG